MTASASASASAVLSFVASRRISVHTASLPQSSLSLSPRRRNYASLLNVPRDVSKLFRAQVKISDELSSEEEEDEACELVNGHDLVIGEGEDTIHAYLLTAVKNNNGAGVLLLSDIFGFEDSSTRDFAYRVACNGFNVLVPDLFRGNPWGIDRPKKSDFDEWIQAQSPLRVSKDIDLCTKWLIDEFKLAGTSEKFGLIGFCFGGGRLIETLARDTNSNFLTGICFYGTRMDPSLSNQIQVPVLFISGDKDQLCPVNLLEEMERNIKGTKLVVYSGRGHGFAHRPESQEEDKDAEDAFGVARNWLQEKLLASAVQSVV